MEDGAHGDGGVNLLCSHRSRRSFSFSFLGRTALASAPEDREHMGVSGVLRAHREEPGTVHSGLVSDGIPEHFLWGCPGTL